MITPQQEDGHDQATPRRAELMANRENDALVTVSGRQPANCQREDATCYNECPPRSSFSTGTTQVP